MPVEPGATIGAGTVPSAGTSGSTRTPSAGTPSAAPSPSAGAAPSAGTSSSAGTPPSAGARRRPRPGPVPGRRDSRRSPAARTPRPTPLRRHRLAVADPDDDTRPAPLRPTAGTPPTPPRSDRPPTCAPSGHVHGSVDAPAEGVAQIHGAALDRPAHRAGSRRSAPRAEGRPPGRGLHAGRCRVRPCPTTLNHATPGSASAPAPSRPPRAPRASSRAPRRCPSTSRPPSTPATWTTTRRSSASSVPATRTPASRTPRPAPWRRLRRAARRGGRLRLRLRHGRHPRHHAVARARR